MKSISRRSCCALVIVLFFSLPPSNLLAGPLSNFDALFSEQFPSFDKHSQSLRQKQRNLKQRFKENLWVDAQQSVQVDSAMGLPTFIHIDPAQKSFFRTAQKRVHPKAKALTDLKQLSSLYRLNDSSLDMAQVSQVHDTGEGPIIVKLQQQKSGVEVFRHEMNLLYDRNQQLLAVSGYLSPYIPVSSPKKLSSNTQATQVIKSALSDLGGPSTDIQVLLEKQNDLYHYYKVEQPPTAQFQLLRPARLKSTHFLLSTHLEPAFYFELEGQMQNSGELVTYAFVYSAEDGRLLFRNNMVSHKSFTYQVYADPVSPHLPLMGPMGNAGVPHPTGQPEGYEPASILQNSIHLAQGPISTNDPWLANGATTLQGNHTNLYSQFGFNWSSPSVTNDAFSFTFDPQQAPHTSAPDQFEASQTYAFYLTNYLHDWFYDVGFDEASGNAQENNYNRGGVQGDWITIGRAPNGNASMSTPADGAPPLMFMGVFEGKDEAQAQVQFISPHTSTIDAGVTNHSWGFDVSGEVVFAKNSSGAINHACRGVANRDEISGKLVYLDMESCSILTQLLNLQSTQAAGVLLGHYGGGDEAIPYDLKYLYASLPIVTLSENQAQALEDLMTQGNVRLTMSQTTTSRDSMMDGSIVAHEYGHYVSNRLIGNSNGLSNPQGRSLGEGWADFHSLLFFANLELSPHDAAYAVGGYAVSTKAEHPYYYGIRRFPYSTDFDKNPLTFRHIEAGVPLPENAPQSSWRPNSSNAESHNVGEIWASALWDAYVALNGRWAFATAQDRMKRYLIESYKLTPISPTFVEARDAMLSAVQASDAEDHLLMKAAFGRRGLGPQAVAPPKSDYYNYGVVEHFSEGHLAIVDTQLEAFGVQCDADQILDSGESMQLTITIKNNGSVPLENTTAILSASDGVQFSKGGFIEFGASEPMQTLSATTHMRVLSTEQGAVLPIKITLSDSLASVPPQTLTLSPRVNYNMVSASTMDDAEKAVSDWTIEHTVDRSTADWKRSQLSSGNNYGFHGGDFEFATDMRMISPPVQVSASGTFRIHFDHLYQFGWEVGVVEYRINGGAWQDLGPYLEQGYTPNRSGYYDESEGFREDQLLSETANLGSTVNGQTVELAFRINSSGANSAFGWFVDNIRFENIDNQPFTAIVANTESCPEVNINYGEGWTLTALPNDSSIAPQQLSTIYADTKAVWVWKDQAWSFYTPSSTLHQTYLAVGLKPLDTAIEPGEGIWIATENASTVPFASGNTYDVSTLPALTNAGSGWTMLGTPTQLLPETLVNLHSTIETIWVWRDRWYVYTPDSSFQSRLIEQGFRALEHIAPGEGFWIRKD